MQHGNGIHIENSEPQKSALVDGLLQDGIDRAASWRARLRESTMARQAAERRYAREGSAASANSPESSALARERAVVLRMELTRIVAEDRAWMQQHGVEMLEPLTRKRRSERSTQP